MFEPGWVGTSIHQCSYVVKLQTETDFEVHHVAQSRADANRRVKWVSRTYQVPVIFDASIKQPHTDYDYGDASGVIVFILPLFFVLSGLLFLFVVPTGFSKFVGIVFIGLSCYFFAQIVIARRAWARLQEKTDTKGFHDNAL